jgi:SAM-dependent methyltransferase
VGRLWAENAERIPPGWDIILSDFSSGMLDEARQTLGDTRPFTFEVLDVQAIPYPDNTFDAVIANHMLYHVPDRPRTLAEIYRVLVPTGVLYASTVGEGHLHELNELIRRWVPDLPERGMPFTLGNGRPQLDAVFPHVERYDYDDALEVTETEPLVAYILSMSASGMFVGDTLRDLTATIDRDIAEHGSIHITKSSGLFVASKS